MHKAIGLRFFSSFGHAFSFLHLGAQRLGRLAAGNPKRLSAAIRYKLIGKLNKARFLVWSWAWKQKASVSIYRRSVTNVRPYSVSSYEIELCLRTDSARPLARSYCLAIRALGERPRFQPLCVPVGMEFVAALTSAFHQIEGDPNHKGRISLPNSLVLTCEPPQYIIGDGEAACFVFPVLDNLREFAKAMESAIASKSEKCGSPEHNRPGARGASRLRKRGEACDSGAGYALVDRDPKRF
jgi:hypothetical protein